MCKRETLILAIVVAAAALAVVFSFPSSVHAASVYPLQGKVINDNLPEIKWEDGEPGDESLGKINFLGSFNGTSKTEDINSRDNDSIIPNLGKNFIFNKVFWKLIINNLLFFVR